MLPNQGLFVLKSNQLDYSEFKDLEAKRKQSIRDFIIRELDQKGLVDVEAVRHSDLGAAFWEMRAPILELCQHKRGAYFIKDIELTNPRALSLLNDDLKRVATKAWKDLLTELK